jgi:hypothetical protein
MNPGSNEHERNKKRLHAWIAFEHSRLHVIAGWPQSARKEALLRAIRSSIGGLMTTEEAASFCCMACRTPGKIKVLPWSLERSRPTGFQEIAA